MQTIKIWSKEDWEKHYKKHLMHPILLIREKRRMQMESRYSQTPSEVMHICVNGLLKAMETDNESEEEKWRDRLTYCGIDYIYQPSKSDLEFWRKYS